MTVRKQTDSVENRRFWQVAERAAAQVRNWPSWKRWHSQHPSEQVLEALKQHPQGLAPEDIETTLSAVGVNSVQSSGVVMDLWGQGKVAMTVDRRWVLTHPEQPCADAGMPKPTCVSCTLVREELRTVTRTYQQLKLDPSYSLCTAVRRASEHLVDMEAPTVDRWLRWAGVPAKRDLDGWVAAFMEAPDSSEARMQCLRDVRDLLLVALKSCKRRKPKRQLYKVDKAAARKRKTKAKVKR